MSFLPNITNYAEETGGNLAAIKADTDKIPSLGQALAAASVPVVLTALQVTALTPPAAITNYAEETGGNLATIAGAISSSVLQANVKNWGGTGVTAATSSNPAGTETAPVVRPILRKQSSILSTTPLTGGAAFTSSWVDTTLTGDVYVYIAAFSNVVFSSSVGIQFQTTDDTTNTNTQQTTIASQGGSSLFAGYPVNQRYWRVVATNGATTQTTFELTATASTVVPQIGLSDLNFVTGNSVPFSALKTAPLSNSGVTEGAQGTYYMEGYGSSVGIPGVGMYAFTGTNNGQYVTFKVANIFHTAQATSSGNTSVWTPASGKKFRLLKFKVIVTANSATSGGGVVTIGFQDSSTAISVAHDVFLPSAAGTTMTGWYDSDWIDLGNGILSATANNVLNVNLSAALSAGNVRVIVCGTEE